MIAVAFGGNGTSEQSVKPVARASFHVMVMLSDAQTGMAIPCAGKPAERAVALLVGEPREMGHRPRSARHATSGLAAAGLGPVQRASALLSRAWADREGEPAGPVNRNGIELRGSG